MKPWIHSSFMSFSFPLNCRKSKVFVSESSTGSSRLTYHAVRLINGDLYDTAAFSVTKLVGQRRNTYLCLYIHPSFIRHSPAYITSVLDRTTGPDQYRLTYCLKLQVLPLYSELVKWDVSLVLEKLLSRRRSKRGEGNTSFMKWALNFTKWWLQNNDITGTEIMNEVVFCVVLLVFWGYDRH